MDSKYHLSSKEEKERYSLHNNTLYDPDYRSFLSKLYKVVPVLISGFKYITPLKSLFEVSEWMGKEWFLPEITIWKSVYSYKSTFSGSNFFNKFIALEW